MTAYKVLHLIDRNTPLDMLIQIGLLAGTGDRIVSIGPPPQVPAGLNVRAVHEPIGSAVLCGLRLRSIARDAEVIHVWSPRAQRAGLAAAAGGSGRVLRSISAVPCSAKARASLLRSFRSRSVTVTAPTRAARDALIRAGLDASHVRVLPSAAGRIDGIPSRRKTMRAELGIPDDAVVLVAPDAMTRPANLNLAAWAHAIMQYAMDSQSWLLLPAGGPMERAVLVFARGAGFIESTVGPWPIDRLPDALAAADVAMFLRADDCGTSAVAAAMAAGLPIVAFDTPDVVECAGPAAMLTEARTPRAAGQALLKLIEQPDLAERLRQASTRRATEFAVDSIRQRLADIYSSLATVSDVLERAC